MDGDADLYAVDGCTGIVLGYNSRRRAPTRPRRSRSGGSSTRGRRPTGASLAAAGIRREYMWGQHLLAAGAADRDVLIDGETRAVAAT